MLGVKCVQLNTAQTFAESIYEEAALFGSGADKCLRFWFFTSDGEHSEGIATDVSDIHPDGIGVEAHMIYWSDDGDRFFWAVESRNKRGWKRLVEHQYLPTKT